MGDDVAVAVGNKHAYFYVGINGSKLSDKGNVCHGIADCIADRADQDGVNLGKIKIFARFFVSKKVQN